MLYPCKSGWNLPNSSWEMVHASTFGLKFGSLSPAVTLKIRARSPKPNQLFIMSHRYIQANLVKIRQPVHEISCKQETVTPWPTLVPTLTPMPTGSALKTICPPPSSVGDIMTTIHSGHISWGQRNYLKWRLYLLWPCFLRRTANITQMIAIPSMAMFLKGGQRNYLKWQLCLLWPFFLRRPVKLPEMTDIPIMAKFLEEVSETTSNEAIPSMAIFLDEDSETTWNDSYTYYGHSSWWGQRNYLKWQLCLLLPCFFRRTEKLPGMTSLPIMAIFLDENSETTWNDSYTYYDQVSWGGQRHNLI